MTFWWRTLCLVPAGWGCRFQFFSLVAQWQIASWKLSELCRVVRFRWWGLLARPVQLSPPVCDLRRCPARRGLWNWWSFCCFGKWGADKAPTLTQSHALLLFFRHSSCASRASRSSLFFLAAYQYGLPWLRCSSADFGWTRRTLCVLSHLK